jgi:hypothetical protein
MNVKLLKKLRKRLKWTWNSEEYLFNVIDIKTKRSFRVISSEDISNVLLAISIFNPYTNLYHLKKHIARKSLLSFYRDKELINKKQKNVNKAIT